MTSYCDGCQHIDRRFLVCSQIKGQMICGQCLQVYPLAEIRCPRCALRSETEAGELRQDGDRILSSAYCPLTKAERERLDKQQATPEPVKNQGTLF